HKIMGCMSSFMLFCFCFFSSRRRHTRFSRDWSSDVCSSDLPARLGVGAGGEEERCEEREAGGEAHGSGAAAVPGALLGRARRHRSEERRVGKEWWTRRSR